MASTRRRRQPSVEILEGRVTPASYTWVGANGGIWDDPANWLGGQPQDVPKSGPAEIHFQGTAVPQTIILEPDDVNFQVTSLTVESGSYTLVGPGADANQPFTLSDGVTLSTKNGGSLSFCTPFSLGGPGIDSLSLTFLGGATETGTGTVDINNQSNAYSNPGLSQFAINSGTLALGSSTAVQASLFAINPGATLLVPTGSMPSIGSLSGGGNVQLGDVPRQVASTSLFIDTPAGRTDTFAGNFLPGPSGPDGVGRSTIQMNGPGTLTVGSIDPLSQGQFQIDVAGGALYVAHAANAQTLSVAPGATFGGQGASTFSGPASFSAKSFLSITLDGTGAGQFGQLTGADAISPPPAVEVGGANLAISVGYNPMAGDSFTIITAPNGAIAGQFANAPDGSTIMPKNSPLPFLVTYNQNANGGVGSLTLTAMALGTTTSVALDPSSTNPSTYGQNVTFDARVAVSGGGPATPTGAVTFYDGNPAAGGTPIGGAQPLVGGKARITTAGLSASTHAIYGVYTPNSVNFVGSKSLPLGHTVLQATPTITWPSPTQITYGTPLGPNQLDATASVPGSFAYTPAAGTVLHAGNNQTLSVIFTPTDRTDYTIAKATTTIDVNQATPTITWPSPAPITFGTPLDPDQLDATASVAGSFAYTPAAGTVLHAGNDQTLSVVFTPTDMVDYATASEKTTINVNQATPTITWPSPAPINYGTALGPNQLDATASVTGLFAYSPAAGTVLHAGNNQTLSVTFTPTDSTDYTTASATTTMSVNQATPTITWPSPAPITFGTALGPNELDATASVSGSFAYTPVAGTVLHAGNNQTLSVIFTPTDGTDYTAASAKTTISVNQATPTITWPNPAPITFGTALGPNQLDATASVAGSFAYTPAAGALLHAGGNQMLFVIFTPTDIIDYTTASTSTTINVKQATPTTTWPSPAPITFGTALGPNQLDATASVAGSFAYSPAAGTVLHAGNNQTLSAVFTPTDSTDYTTASATTTMSVNQATATITWPSPAPITFGTALGPNELDASASVGGSFAYTPAAGTALQAGNNQTLSVSFTPTNSTDYTTSSATTTINVNQATPVITWPSPAPITFGTSLGSAQLDASAPVAGSFAYTPAAGAVLHAGNNQALSVSFTPTDSTDYTTASATTAINVNRATPAISWVSPAPIAHGTALGAAQLDATASVPGTFVYAPAAGTVLGLGNNQRLSATFAPMDQSDYTSATATTTITVVPATTVVALASSSVDPSTYGQSVAFQAVVATIGCNSSAITGTVAFYDGKPGAGGVEIGSPQPVTAGDASIATATLSAGTHAIYAVYHPGSGTAARYTSAPLYQIVRAASARLTIRLVPPSGGSGGFYTVLAQVTTSVPGLVPSGRVSFRLGQGRRQQKVLSRGVAVLERTLSRPVNQTLLVTFQGDRTLFVTSPVQVEF